MDDKRTGDAGDLTLIGHDLHTQNAVLTDILTLTLPIQSSPQRARELFVNGQRTVPQVWA